jgi:hypothetical protein
MTDQLSSNSQSRSWVFDSVCRFLFHAGLLVGALAIVFVIFAVTF